MNAVLVMIRCGHMKGFEKRKKDHLRLSLLPEVKGSHQKIDDPYHSILLEHCALPELNFSEIQCDQPFLNHKQLTPFFIAAMTAGHPGANEINNAFAKACSDRGWIFCVGSLRREFEEGGTTLESWKKFRKNYHSLSLIGNIGASQFSFVTKSEKKLKINQLKKVMDVIRPDAFAVHLNALQEVVQSEGTPTFKGVFDFLMSWEENFPEMPLVLKETGCGFSKQTLKKLSKLKSLVAVDVSGFGGTHWGRIEGLRAKEKKANLSYELSETFKNWGISTIDSVQNANEVFKNSKTEIWASGGVSNGLQAAKLISIGAHRVGFAGEALKAYQKGTASLNQFMELKELELKTALFCTGNSTLSEMKKEIKKS